MCNKGQANSRITFLKNSFEHLWGLVTTKADGEIAAKSVYDD